MILAAYAWNCFSTLTVSDSSFSKIDDEKMWYCHMK